MNQAIVVRIHAREPLTMTFSDEFMQGQKDCIAGTPHKDDMTDAYNRGYSTQKTLQGIKDDKRIINTEK